LLADHRGLITGEACPHHLLFSVDDYARLGTLVQMNPSIKTRDDNAELWRALADGRLQVVATDHAPHSEVDKAVEFGAAANGISGIETALGLVLSAVDGGQLTLLRGIEALTSGPASIVGTRSRRADSVGLVEGASADIVIFDRADAWTVSSDTLMSRGKNTPLAGMRLPGRVLVTIAAGRIAYEAPEA